MVSAVLGWEHFPNTWCRNVHQMCPPPFLQERTFSMGQFCRKRAFTKELGNYQKLTHRKPLVSLRENRYF